MEGTKRALLVVAFLAVLSAVLAGCTSGPPPSTESVSGEQPPSERHWTCVPLDENAAGRISSLTESWTVEGGSMFSAHRTATGGDDSPGVSSRDEAFTSTVEQAAGAAMDLLEQRGIKYELNRRQGIIDEVVDAAGREVDVAFPRVSIVERSWEECVARADARADTSWRAAVLVEYPIGLLRGDVNNVLWERGRAANEAFVLRQSAEEHLGSGRWHEGLLDVARVADVVRATGAPLRGIEDESPLTENSRPRSDDARLRSAHRWSRDILLNALSLRATPVDGVDVLETGAASRAVVRFRCTYEWNGAVLPASGVPVRFGLSGASAVLDGEPLTDASGIATCRVLAAYGPPGEYDLTLSLDEEAAHVALSSAVPPLISQAVHGDTEAKIQFAPLAYQTVHLVKGAHAVSVCATFGERGDGSAAQVAAGFDRRMERDGFHVEECGPGVDVIVTGAFVLTARNESGSWVAAVTLSASAFDQRTASGLGETVIHSTETVSTEDAEDGRRDAEVLALREAGRLLAVYLGPRMLAER